MKEKVFADLNGIELIVRYRKSAVFFLKRYRELDLVEHQRAKEVFIDGNGLGWIYRFSEDEFNRFILTLREISSESWKNFNPREADSFGSEYDGYYDKEFDNNGCLGISKNYLSIEGPYAQKPNDEKLTRLIKFNKRQFESFIHDLNGL